MGTILSLVAVIIAIASVLAALGHLGYLALLRNAAHKRAGGAAIAEYVDSRWRLAGGTAVTSLLALLLTAGSSVPLNLLAIAIAAGSGTVTTRALQSTHARYRIER